MFQIHEEVGYDIPTSRIEKIIQCRSGVGATGALMTLFYCEVDDKDRVKEGGGVDDELIEVVECSIDEAKKMVEVGSVLNSPPSFIFGLMWFLHFKAPK